MRWVSKGDDTSRVVCLLQGHWLVQTFPGVWTQEARIQCFKQGEVVLARPLQVTQPTSRFLPNMMRIYAGGDHKLHAKTRVTGLSFGSGSQTQGNLSDYSVQYFYGKG